jgi:hypothetical protein
VSDVSPKVLKLSFAVSECKLLVVGSGAALREGGLGARIDGHHLIARLNNAPSRGWEEHVGQARYQFVISFRSLLVDPSSVVCV